MHAFNSTVEVILKILHSVMVVRNTRLYVKQIMNLSLILFFIL